MKARQWERLVSSEVLPLLPSGYAVRGKLLYKDSPRNLLVGINADSSGYSRTEVYLEAFVMPLFVPRDHIAYVIGDRLGGWSHTETVGETLARSTIELIVRDGLPFMQRFHTLADFVNAMRTDPGSIIDLEIEAYSRLILGDVSRARALLLQALAQEPEFTHDHVVLNRCEQILGLLRQADGTARAQLSSWESETLDHLKIPT